MKMTQSQRDLCVIMRWFDQEEVNQYKVKTPALQITAHETKNNTENRERRRHDTRRRHKPSKRGIYNKNQSGIRTLRSMGRRQSDHHTCDIEMHEQWFLPKMNERFITNDEGEPVMLLGIDLEYKEKGEMELSHRSSISRFMGKHSMETLQPSVVPCTKELAKEITYYIYDGSMLELQQIEEILPVYRTYLGAMGH